MDKISVIIPVYNVEPYIRQCLDSIVNQTYQNLEIIIIDDGSPDQCGEICDEYAEDDGRIQIIHKGNEGLCAARNDGIKAATGDWITFVDSDDWLDVDYYERMADALTNSEADILCSQGCIIETSQRSAELHTFEEPGEIKKGNDINTLLCKILVPRHMAGFTISAGTVWDKFFRTSFVHSMDLLFDTNARAWEDLWFSLQAFPKAKRVSVVMQVGYHYRMVQNSITKAFNENRPHINYDFIDKIHGLFGSVEDDSIAEAINARAIILMQHSLRFCFFHPSNTKSWKDIATDVKEMKKWPYYHKAIWSNDNHFLTLKQIVSKYMFRLPWIGPLKLLYMGNEIYKKASKN